MPSFSLYQRIIRLSNAALAIKASGVHLTRANLLQKKFFHNYPQEVMDQAIALAISRSEAPSLNIVTMVWFSCDNVPICSRRASSNMASSTMSVVLSARRSKNIGHKKQEPARCQLLHHQKGYRKARLFRYRITSNTGVLYET